VVEEHGRVVFVRGDFGAEIDGAEGILEGVVP